MGIFMSVTPQDAVYLGQDYSQNQRSMKNQLLKSVKQLFRTTEKLINDQVEITGLSTIDWNQPMWRRSSLLCDRAVHIMKSKTYVFSESVLCLGGISTGRLVAEVIPTAISLVQVVVVFRLPATFNSLAADGECEQ